MWAWGAAEIFLQRVLSLIDDLKQGIGTGRGIGKS
jgi:hypothetical protein